MLELRDANGKVYNTIENPAIVYDSDVYTLIKIGEAREVKAYYNRVMACMKSQSSKVDGMPDMKHLVNSLVYMEIPRNQELLDKLMNITGFLRQFVETMK